MGMQYRKSKMVLNYRESKPEVWKARQITFPMVSYEQLVEEIAQSRGVNTNQTRAVVDALLNRLVHYMEIGHGVKMGDFGSFKPVFTSKTVKNLEDLDGDEALKTVKVKKVMFFPGKAFKDMVDDLALESAGEALDVKE
jgi:predicted histone-like DNA-binding protein